MEVGVTVIITDRTKTVLFPVKWARSQKPGELGANARSCKHIALITQVFLELCLVSGLWVLTGQWFFFIIQTNVVFRPNNTCN